ncbi:Protein kinase [Halanaerobium saccharolyticum subsp. saccharolyticum DSM 6643]|uniref:Protein kinase n=2 Tax=Halanaerobium saccharolyticum TaxID=43595 RepID=M5E3Z8_9FIRM|nr:Protein kinase [Halanaerobium saccharolyticum subsp. saccharolyticum DSM 6643]
MDNFAYSNLITAGGIVMSKDKAENKNLNKEKLFKDTVPRSRVQLDVVKRVRSALENMPAELPAKIISYQDIIRENGEYYLLYKGSSDLKPLVEYLNKNSISLKKLLQEFKEVLEILEQLELIKNIFPDGINAGNFYIDEQENIYLMPEQLLRSKRNYNEFKFEAPVSDYFRPPEIIEGESWQQHSYIFNTAAVFYYFLSSETIFSDNDQAKVLNKIQSENILELKTLVPQISNSLNNLFMKMLDREKNKRPSLDFIFEELENTTLEKQFELQPFFKRKNIIDNKIVKKKRKKENIKLFFRQSWKPLLFFVILFSSLFWGLSSGPDATITADNSPEEVVNYFYGAIAAKNIRLADEAAEFDLGKMERLISESYVIEKMQAAYSEPNSDREIKQVYSLENFRLEKLSSSENSHTFKAFYEFNFRNSEELYSIELEDQILVEKFDEVWKIKKINGDMKDMIAGEYPWGEE